MKIKEKDTLQIINRINKLNNEEIVYVLKGCIVYDKILHVDVEFNSIDINDLSKIEIINLVGYSLFALEMNDVYTSSKLPIINNIVKKIEKKLNIEFINNNNNRYLYRQWGSNFIKFTARPLILQIPIRLLVYFEHYWFLLALNFKYESKNRIGFLYSLKDDKKENLIFIHGFGFGYIPFTNLLVELNKKYNLIIIIMPTISGYSFYDDLNYNHFPQLSTLSNTIYEFIENKNLNNIKLLSHSFGTYITQILRKDKRCILFKKIIMVDPIIFWIGCFKMSLQIDYPYIRTNNYVNYFYDLILNYIIYKCLYLKYICYRVMFGPDFWIYNAKELENSNITIILEKNDNIIPADLLYEKAKDHVKCYYIDDDEAIHGSILIEKKYLNQILQIIDE